MNKNATELISLSEKWLLEDVLPLWSKSGFDAKERCFVESLTAEGIPTNSDRRALVQARQIYSFLTAAKLNLFNKNQSDEMITGAVQYLLQKFQTPYGSFFHAVDLNGQISNKDVDLYTQAFSLFALACGYEATKNIKYKEEALRLLNYLVSERIAIKGGYTEIKNGKIYYQSNPHMHLFEAALAWLQVDDSKEWLILADQLYLHCITKFIDPTTGTLCEHFNEGWTQQTVNEKDFIFEPGHHYEWAWLLAWYQDLTRISTRELQNQLFSVAENHGVLTTGFVVDEVLSNFAIHKKSARFWPQCERIKAAVKLGLSATREQQPNYAKAADDALTTLFKYFNLPIRGLWQDTYLATGEFSKQDPKASSLYHIINAMSEYMQIRPKLFDGE